MTRNACRDSRLARALAAALALALPACVPDLSGIFDICGEGGCPPPPPQDCATLASDSWTIGPGPTATENEIQVALGESRGVSLSPFIAAHCLETVASVTWSAGDPSVAAVTAKAAPHRGAWVTGLRPGPGTIHARIAFPDGSARQAMPRAFVVGGPAERAGTIVFEGTVRLDRNPEWTRFIPFELPASASRIDVTADWGSVLNQADVFLYRGTCAGSSNCGGMEFIGLPSVIDRKPVDKSVTMSLAPGPYTIRVDNLGPGAETVRYQVRFTPR